MRLIASFFAVFLCVVSLAQGHDTVLWQKDELISADWKIKGVFQSLYGLRVSEQTWKDVGTKHKHLVVEAYWLKTQSTLPNDSLHFRQLAQLIFDVYEIEARIFQSQVNDPEEDIQMLSRAYENRAREKSAEIVSHSFYGRNTDSLRLFREEINEQLKRINRKNEPPLEPTGFQMFLQLNGTGIATVGTFNRYCSSMTGAGVGIVFGYKNLLLSISHSRGKATIADSLVKADFGIYQGDNVQFRQWWYQLGYEFLDYHRLNFSAYAGANSFRLINRSNPAGSLSSHGPIMLNFSLSGQMNYSFPPFSHDNQSETQLDIFLRCSYNRYNYLFEMNGAGVSFQVGLQLKLRTLRFPKSDLI